MGLVYADIELINSDDLALVRHNKMDKDEIRKLHVNMMVDSGAYMMAINETIQSQLELPFIESRKVQVADGRLVEYDVVGPVDVRFANRKSTCTAFVLPGDSKPSVNTFLLEDKPVLLPYYKILNQQVCVSIKPPNSRPAGH
jgi:hypothetical protein